MISFADQWTEQYSSERGLVEAVLQRLHIEARQRDWRGSVLVAADWVKPPQGGPICAITIGPGFNDRWVSIVDVRDAVMKAKARAAQAAREPEPALL